MSNTIYNGSYPSIAENYVYSSTGTSKVKTKSDAGSNTAKTSDTASIKDTSTVNNTKADGKVAVNGQTIGNPRLSEKASKYYDQLKKKYSNMNFILVSEDQKEYAKAQASNYANANNMVVLIDEDKIERMAEDENYRKQYEGIIANAASGLSQLGQSIAATGANVKGYGMQVNDGGTASFFAVLKKSGAAQKERIAKKAEQKKEAKKAEAKKAKKKEEQERLENKKDSRIDDNSGIEEDEDTVTITASSMEELLQVGVITSTHGVRGEVKVFPTTDDPERFKTLKHVLLDTGREKKPLEIQGVKFFKQFVILKFKGIDNINDIERYKRCPLLVERKDAVALEEDEYFIADMIGIQVVTEDDEPFGTLKDVMETGANDVYVIDTEEHGEVLVPAIRECILDVDIENQKMKIHLMDGLI